MSSAPDTAPQAGLFSLLKPYRLVVGALVLLTVVANSINLAVPKLLGNAIDGFAGPAFSLTHAVWWLSAVAVALLVVTYAQNIVQTLAAERVARDLRLEVSKKISEQNYAFVVQKTPSVLLTNLTSDVDAVKNFVAQAIASLISSVFLIIGASTLLLLINWRLALVVLAVLPVIGIAFYVVFSRVRVLFGKSQEAIDWLNKVINESILGAALIRLLNAHAPEYEKFLAASTEAKNIGFKILRLFAGLIPAITFATNLAILSILVLGGHFLIGGTLTLGEFSAFMNYLAILIFPIIILGFTSTAIAQAGASYARIRTVLDAPAPAEDGTRTHALRGDVSAEHLVLTLGTKEILKDISFTTPAGTKTAILGPTAAGKTQLLYALTNLLVPTSGRVLFDGMPSEEYHKQSLRSQVGLVFQDSSIFNLSLRENIAFSTSVSDADLEKALRVAELTDFVKTLPDGLDTVVSERGTSLSGGQKQRIMLARALALNPRVLLLDDFTARVDAPTEKKILANIDREYPGLTLISVTQKIVSVESYDQILVLMDGEILARGTHEELLASSPEYVQMYESQQSTTAYELQT